MNYVIMFKFEKKFKKLGHKGGSSNRQVKDELC